MIPKIIHSVWIGRKSKPDKVIRCEISWQTYLPGYEFKEWTEDNFDINSHPYLKIMYDNEEWAFASDYIRLKVLEKYGGFYFDKDIILKKSFDPLLNAEFVIGFSFDCALGTGVIGSVPNYWIINDCIKIYDYVGGEKYFNNSIFTWYFLKKIKGFQLTGKTQYIFNGINVYHRKYFDSPTSQKHMGFSENLNLGSILENRNNRLNIIFKKAILILFGTVVYNDLKIWWDNMHIKEFYSTYKHHRHNRIGYIVPKGNRLIDLI